MKEYYLWDDGQGERRNASVIVIHPWRDYSMGPINQAIFVISATLSVFGSLLILISYNVYKNIQTQTRHIIACLSLADLVSVLANLTGVFMKPSSNKPDLKCILQSFIGTTAVFSSYLWTMLLAIYLYMGLVKDNLGILERLLHPWFHLLCWLLPLGINVVALCMNKLGNSGDHTSSGWCWIEIELDENESRLDHIIWMIIDCEGVAIITLVVAFVLYFKIKIHLKKQLRESTSRDGTPSVYVSGKTVRAVKDVDRKILLVPIMFFILRIWGTIRFFLYVTHYHGNRSDFNNIDKALILLQTIGDNLQGFVDSILFCFLNKKIRYRLENSIIKNSKNCFHRRPNRSMLIKGDNKEIEEDDDTSLISSINQKT